MLMLCCAVLASCISKCTAPLRGAPLQLTYRTAAPLIELEQHCRRQLTSQSCRLSGSQLEATPQPPRLTLSLLYMAHQLAASSCSSQQCSLLLLCCATQMHEHLHKQAQLPPTSYQLRLRQSPLPSAQLDPCAQLQIALLFFLRSLEQPEQLACSPSSLAQFFEASATLPQTCADARASNRRLASSKATLAQLLCHTAIAQLCSSLNQRTA